MKVHIVDSTKSFLKAVEKPLKGLSYSTTLSMKFDEAIDNIHEHAPRIVLINWGKENSDVINLCKKIRRLKLTKYIYIIVIAAREKQVEMKKVIKAGADDFIFKPLGKNELALKLIIAERTIKLEDKVSKSQKKLIKLAKEDPVTNLLNRRSLMDDVLKEMGRASREMKYFSSIMSGITNFKIIIGTYGSEIGDDVLVEYSRRLQSICRPYDLSGRYGISEFLVFLPNARLNSAEKVARRLQKSIVEKPFRIKGRIINVTVGIGVSELNPDEIASNNKIDAHLLNDLLLDSLIKRSEESLYKAEKEGKNKIVITKAF